MKYLETQDELEVLLGRQEAPSGVVLPNLTIIWFSATWCGPCRRVDGSALEESFPEINWMKCDVDLNNYSAGYCGIRAIPAFLAILDKKVVSTLQSSSNEQIANWAAEQLDAARQAKSQV